MFSILTIVGLAAGLAMVLSTTTVEGPTSQGEPANPPAAPAPRMGLLVRLIYLGFLGVMAVLALTGLTTWAFSDEPMRHWILMLHATVAPPFAICVALLAVIWANQCRFGCPSKVGFGAFRKLLFWVMLPCAIVVILSAVLPMTGFNTHQQHLLYYTHRYSSLAFVIAAGLHALGFLRSAK